MPILLQQFWGGLLRLYIGGINIYFQLESRELSPVSQGAECQSITCRNANFPDEATDFQKYSSDLIRSGKLESLQIDYHTGLCILAVLYYLRFLQMYKITFAINDGGNFSLKFNFWRCHILKMLQKFCWNFFFGGGGYSRGKNARLKAKLILLGNIGQLSKLFWSELKPLADFNSNLLKVYLGHWLTLLKVLQSRWN